MNISALTAADFCNGVQDVASCVKSPPASISKQPDSIFIKKIYSWIDLGFSNIGSGSMGGSGDSFEDP